MNDKITGVTFHHFGLALKDFSKALRFYTHIGYQCTTPVIDPIQRVELVFCTAQGHPAVELIKPIDKQSPIHSYLNKANEWIYHTCYELDHIERDGPALFAQVRAICVSPPKPAILFNHRLVAFYYINDVGLIEVLQR